MVCCGAYRYWLVYMLIVDIVDTAWCTCMHALFFFNMSPHHVHISHHVKTSCQNINQAHGQMPPLHSATSTSRSWWITNGRLLWLYMCLCDCTCRAVIVHVHHHTCVVCHGCVCVAFMHTYCMDVCAHDNDDIHYWYTLCILTFYPSHWYLLFLHHISTSYVHIIFTHLVKFILLV